MLQNKPDPWSCAVTAFAMAIDIPVQQLIEEIGHDGGEKIFTHLPDPMCRRGFHSQELIQAAWQHGFACTPIEMYPRLTCEPFPGTFPPRDGLSMEKDVWTPEAAWTRFQVGVGMTRGVMEGQGCRCHHAVYYHFGQIWDPDGEQCEYSLKACEARSFYGNRLWVFTENGLV